MTDAYLRTSDKILVLQVAKDLKRHEGFREFAYPDPLSKLAKKYPNARWGFEPATDILERLGIPLQEARKLGAPWTVGFGFTANVNPETTIDRHKAERMLEAKILDMDTVLRQKLSFFATASFVTKTILINMAFNMGVAGLLTFKNTLRYVGEKNYKQAATNMRKSLWFQQVGRRAEELSTRMETQSIPAEYKAPETL